MLQQPEDTSPDFPSARGKSHGAEGQEGKGVIESLTSRKGSLVAALFYQEREREREREGGGRRWDRGRRRRKRKEKTQGDNQKRGKG